MIELNLTKSEPSLCQFDFEAVCIHKGELEEGLKVRVAHVAKNRDCGTLGHKSLAERFKPSRTQDFQKSSRPRLRRRQDCWRQAGELDSSGPGKRREPETGTEGRA